MSPVGISGLRSWEPRGPSKPVLGFKSRAAIEVGLLLPDRLAKSPTRWKCEHAGSAGWPAAGLGRGSTRGSELIRGHPDSKL